MLDVRGERGRSRGGEGEPIGKEKEREGEGGGEGKEREKEREGLDERDDDLLVQPGEKNPKELSPASVVVRGERAPLVGWPGDEGELKCEK